MSPHREPETLSEAERLARDLRRSALHGQGHSEYIADRAERSLRRMEMGDHVDD